MISELKDIRNNLSFLLYQAAKTGQVKTMYIDYHKPFVSRIWFPYLNRRVFIHRIEPCNDRSEVLYHPHKWDSAMEILYGSYEMRVGHSETSQIPKTDCRLILGPGTVYEMREKDGWHSVRPINEPCYTLMITGSLNGRKMPQEPNKSFRVLTAEEIDQLLFKTFWSIDPFRTFEYLADIPKLILKHQ